MRLKSLLLSAIVLALSVAAAGQQYASTSLLAGGKWVRIAVTTAGLYRLDYSQLVEMGFSNPSLVALYGNNCGQLSFYNDRSAPDDLRRIAVKYEKGSDAIFNSGDYILFYAEGTARWKKSDDPDMPLYSRHYYSDTAWYFLSDSRGAGPEIETSPEPSTAYNSQSSATDLACRHEEEKVSLIKSGREWYQQVVPGIQTVVSPDFRNVSSGEKIKIRGRFLARSDTESSFTISVDGVALRTITVPPVSMTDLNGVYAAIVTYEDSCLPVTAKPAFTVSFNNGGNLAATGYIDYIDYYGRGDLSHSGSQLFISDSRSVSEGAVTKFTVSGSSSLAVWDITDPFTPLGIATRGSTNSSTFTVETDSLRRFIAFSSSDLMRPAITGKTVVNQDLHALMGTDMIIVTHPSFLSYANKLSGFHETSDGITSVVVTPEEIYNEFSGGIPDAVAIRNFVRMIYLRSLNSQPRLKYLVLFGDGSYENKTPPPGNSSFIPTWQSQNSYVGVLSFTSDDFFGLLDDGEGEAAGYLDIGIGRLPVSDTTQAAALLNKIFLYSGSSTFGSWRDRLCMVADDEDANLHMIDAENLAITAKAGAPPLTIDKVYLDAYRQVTTVTGSSYPDAVEAVDNEVNAGCLIFNYVGHGNESGLAHERVVRTDNINSWNNGGRLPLFITATCEFSRFDDAEINSSTGVISPRTSAGEMVLLNPDGGGIALMSTTRVVYSAPNYTLNRNIYENAFLRADDGGSMRLGDIIRQAKVNSGSGTNKRNFLLLGDPALRLAYPVNGSVVTDSINGVAVSEMTDTIKALSLVTVSGHIEEVNGGLMEGFNGVTEAAVYDKESTITTLANDGGTPMSFPVTGNMIFRGTTPVTNGRFRFSFIVPLDINYSYGNGSMSYYAHNDDTDLNGSFSRIVVGGFSENAATDTEGPEIRLFMNDTLFKEGGITDSSPTLLALLSDPSGINTTGTGIGHDIVAWLDDDPSGAVVLNSLFYADLGVHTSGSVTYPLIVTEKGRHTLSFRAWDNHNNPTTATLGFAVETDGIFRLSGLLCYPNPAVDRSWFTAGHNRPDSKIDVTLSIISSSGQVVRIIRKQVDAGGYSLPEIEWDCCYEGGGRVARGLYIWRLQVTTEGGERAYASGRIIIL